MSGPTPMSRLNPTLRDAEALVGIAYEEGTFDCGHLVVRAQRELFGREVVLPLTGPHPRSRLGQAHALLRCREALGYRVQLPRSGDAVMFLEATLEGQHYHLGTVLVECGQTWVLHTRAGGASVLNRLEECLRSGLVLEGFYRWH